MAWNSFRGWFRRTVLGDAGMLGHSSAATESLQFLRNVKKNAEALQRSYVKFTQAQRVSIAAIHGLANTLTDLQGWQPGNAMSVPTAYDKQLFFCNRNAFSSSLASSPSSSCSSSCCSTSTPDGAKESKQEANPPQEELPAKSTVVSRLRASSSSVEKISHSLSSPRPPSTPKPSPRSIVQTRCATQAAPSPFKTGSSVAYVKAHAAANATAAAKLSSSSPSSTSSSSSPVRIKARSSQAVTQEDEKERLRLARIRGDPDVLMADARTLIHTEHAVTSGILVNSYRRAIQQLDYEIKQAVACKKAYKRAKQELEERARRLFKYQRYNKASFNVNGSTSKPSLMERERDAAGKKFKKAEEELVFACKRVRQARFRVVPYEACVSMDAHKEFMQTVVDQMESVKRCWVA